MDRLRVLGIDPGTLKSGWAVVDAFPNALPKRIDSDCLLNLYRPFLKISFVDLSPSPILYRHIVHFFYANHRIDITNA